jgi:heme exporter protein D
MSLGEFLHMGGYGAYVWSSYGIALVVLAANIFGPLLSKKRLLADLARRERREQAAARTSE